MRAEPDDSDGRLIARAKSCYGNRPASAQIVSFYASQKDSTAFLHFRDLFASERSRLTILRRYDFVWHPGRAMLEQTDYLKQLV